MASKNKTTPTELRRVVLFFEIGLMETCLYSLNLVPGVLFNLINSLLIAVAQPENHCFDLLGLNRIFVWVLFKP